MTEVAVLANEFSVLRLVKVVVAAEASGELHVAAVVGVEAPSDPHSGEDVSLVKVLHVGHRAGDVGLALRPGVRILLLVKLIQGLLDR